MADLQHYAYPGVGQLAVEKYGYQQAVRVGDRIECSGQGVFPTPIHLPSLSSSSNSH
jgi:hypothetical protein